MQYIQISEIVEFMKNIKHLSKTEKILSVLISALFLAIVVRSVETSGNLLRFTHAEEDSETSEVSTPSSDESDDPDGDEEESTQEVDEVSTPSVDEESTPEVDEVSTSEVDEVSTPSMDEVSTPESDEVSVSELDEVSTPSVDERSVRSGDNIQDVSDLDEVIPVGDDTAIVFEDGRLFFLIPVKVQKTLLLDEEGTVVDVQQTLLNRILSLLSF